MNECFLTDTVRVLKNDPANTRDEYGDLVFVGEYTSLKCRINHVVSHDSLGIEGNQSRMLSNERTTRVRLYAKSPLMLGDLVFIEDADLARIGLPSNKDGFTVQLVGHMRSPHSCIEYYKMELS